MRIAAFVLVGGALLCVGPPACGGSDDATSSDAGSDACTPTLYSPLDPSVTEYWAAHDDCDFATDCKLLSHLVFDACHAWCETTLRWDAVNGLYEVFKHAKHNCRTCSPDPTKYFPECGHGYTAEAACEAGKCIVKYTKIPSGNGDAAVDAADAGAESDSTTAGENIDATTPDASGE